MEKISYQRPREKAEQAGLSTLSISELIQLIIGSGSSAVPVAKIARSIEQLLARTLSTPRHRDLTELAGVGVASAWRILAALELGKMISTSNISFYEFDFVKFRKSKKALLGYATFDSSGHFIEESVCKIGEAGATSFVVRSLCAEVLAKSGFTMQLLLYEPISKNTPTQNAHALVSELADLSGRLQLEVARVTWLSKNTSIIVKGSRV